MKSSFVITLLSLAAVAIAEERGLRGFLLSDISQMNERAQRSVVDDRHYVPNKCFSADATALVKGKGFTPMKELQVGDRIFTGESYQPIYAFGHHQPDVTASFLEIQTYHFSLEVSPEHLLFVDGKDRPVRADSVRRGDTIQGAAVMKVGPIEKTGLYSPLTASGTLIVDGMKASAYVSLQDSPNIRLKGGLEVMSQHTFMHMMLSPVRMMCMGFSNNFCSHEETGVPKYIEYVLRMVQWCETLNLVAQLLLFVLFAVCGSILMVYENIFGAFMAPLMMVTSIVLLKALMLARVCPPCKSKAV